LHVARRVTIHGLSLDNHHGDTVRGKRDVSQKQF
jgi:hypothetical protein